MTSEVKSWHGALQLDWTLLNRLTLHKQIRLRLLWHVKAQTNSQTRRFLPQMSCRVDVDSAAMFVPRERFSRTAAIILSSGLHCHKQLIAVMKTILVNAPNYLPDTGCSDTLALRKLHERTREAFGEVHSSNFVCHSPHKVNGWQFLCGWQREGLNYPGGPLGSPSVGELQMLTGKGEE